ncbi:MAG: 30S ribosomal protein S27e [Nitrososphaerota archaeon]|nr:30S ribosomal protein S27e [Nitrososphaerota archaeon]
MPRKERVLYPKPRSSFLLVKCASCATERVVYSNAAVQVKCDSCGEVLAEPTGGRANILAEVIKKMD